MHNPSISILGPGPDVMLIEGFDCSHSGNCCIVPQVYTQVDTYGPPKVL